MSEPADSPDELRLTVDIAADPGSVWNAVAAAERRRAWWPDLELEAHARRRGARALARRRRP